ncbi:hypothetical protein EDC96DRAFT_564979 [Choanephora cucurbitarum]|nr:hypothetical protein EDC96DRAFT_564979 [Choanephora cucurbitarum]
MKIEATRDLSEVSYRCSLSTDCQVTCEYNRSNVSEAMSYRRALQNSFYLGGPYTPTPQLSVNVQQQPSPITPGRIPRAKLRDNINHEKNKKNPNYSALKAKTLAGQIPKGLYADMDKHANLELRESANKFLNDNAVSRAIVLWREYVQQNFDVILDSVSNPTTEATSSTQAIEPSPEELPTEPASFVAAEEYFEVCTAYFPSLIRDNLAPEVRQILDTKLAELLPQTSNFISDFQVIMFMIIYLDFSASPYASNFLVSPDANDIPFLFTDRHVHFLKSGFYGVRGLQTKTKTEYPLRTLLMEAISDSVNQFIQPKNTLRMACYESALTNYITNLSVMWGDNKMINILLDKLLLVLLRIHLAPTRERRHQEFIKSMKDASKERKDKAAKGSKTEADHPTNWFPLIHQSIRRLIVRKERYRLAKYRQKSNRSSSADMKQKWEARAQKSEKRIATYTKALETKACMSTISGKSEPKAASTKRKQSSEPDVAEGSERSRKIPARYINFDQVPNEVYDRWRNGSGGITILGDMVESFFDSMFLGLYDEMSSLTDSLGEPLERYLRNGKQQQATSFFFFLEVK